MDAWDKCKIVSVYIILSVGLIGCHFDNEDAEKVLSKNEETIEKGIDTVSIAEEENIVYVISMRKGTYFNGRFDWTEWEYDQKANVVKIISYDEKGNILEWSDCVYNDKGERLKQTSYDKQGEIVYVMEFEYDSNGKMIKLTTHDEEGFNGWTEYENDNWGNMIKQISYDEEGNIQSWVENEYDHNGNKIKVTDYDQVGTEGEEGYYSNIRREGYDYDEKGNIVKKIEYNENWIPSSFEIYEYDEEGNVIKIVKYGGNESDIWGTEKYAYKNEGSKKIITNYKYDSYGELISWEEKELDYPDKYRVIETNTIYNADGSVDRDWWETEVKKIKVK